MLRVSPQRVRAGRAGKRADSGFDGSIGPVQEHREDTIRFAAEERILSEAGYIPIENC